MAGMSLTAVVLGIHHADSRLVRDNRREDFCRCVAGNDYHIETDGADRRHRFELLYLQCARARGVYHSGILGDGNKYAGETADMRRCHRAAFLTASLSRASAAVVP